MNAPAGLPLLTSSLVGDVVLAVALFSVVALLVEAWAWWGSDVDS